MIAAADVHEAAWTGHLSAAEEAARRLVAVLRPVAAGSAPARPIAEAVEW